MPERSAIATLEGAVVVITGGGSGIGLASARPAAREGASVVVADRSRAGLDTADAELRDLGAPVLTCEVDVTDAGEVAELVNATIAAFGRVDGLVTSAGIEGAASALDVSEDLFDLVLDVNLKGSFLCAQAVASAMVGSGTPGAIVTVSSALAFSGRVGAAPYSASKGAIVALTKALALEWGPQGIRVNAVAPGLIDTPIAAGIPDDLRREYASRTPLRRIGQAADVAKVVRFLLSDESGYVTGQTIVVNGGYSMPS